MDPSSTTAQQPSSSLTSPQPQVKNVKNLSIKDFFTSRLMRARSFEANANSLRDETSSWFDEFKARMTKRSGGQAGVNKPSNLQVEDCESIELAAHISKPEHDCLSSSTTKSDNIPEVVRNKSDIDCGRKIKKRKNAPGDSDHVDISKQSLDDKSFFDLDAKSMGLRERRTNKISSVDRADFDTGSINTIYNRRDSRYVWRKKSPQSLIYSKALMPFKWIISRCLPLDYNLPWKVITLISVAFVMIVTCLTNRTEKSITTFSFLNGFLCGLVVAFICFLMVSCIVVMTFFPKSQNSTKSGTSTNKSPTERLSRPHSRLTDDSHELGMSEDFSIIEILEGNSSRNETSELSSNEKRVDSPFDEDYKGWMIEFIGDYELRNKSDVKLKLIYVKIEDRVLYLCKPKSGQDADTSLFPTLISQRVYDLNIVKKFTVNLLLPKSVRNIQKWVWSKKYPIRLDFQCENESAQSRASTESTKEVNLTLFAKSCREKEEWFRRFKTIVEDNRLAQFHIFKRSSLQSDGSGLNEETSCTSSRATSIRSTSPAGFVQTSKSSHFLNENRDPDEEMTINLGETGIKRTKSCEELNANTSTSDTINLDPQEGVATPSKSQGRDDSTLTKETADLFSQELEDNHFLESRPNISYRAYIERVIESGKDASSTSDWFNALTGRIFFDVFSHNYWSVWFKRKIQRKLYRIRLPYFMETLTLTRIDLGTNAPHFLNVVSHSFDSFGLSIDFDMTYNGGLTMTFETKLNLLKIKSDNSASSHNSTSNISQPVLNDSSSCNTQSQTSQSSSENLSKPEPSNEGSSTKLNKRRNFKPSLSSSGSARTSGESSESTDEDSDSSSDSSLDDDANNDEISDWEDYGAEKTRQNIVKFVDKIASSRYFQHATENRYIKKKLQNISNCPLVLVVQIQSLEGVLTLNVPPPQTDRVWYGFQPDPKLVLKALPKMGDREVNMSHVTDWIERKLAEEFRKILVIPNMEDIVLPVLKSDHLSYVASTK